MLIFFWMARNGRDIGIVRGEKMRGQLKNKKVEVLLVLCHFSTANFLPKEFRGNAPAVVVQNMERIIN